MPQTAKLHADIARAIAPGDEDKAARRATGCSTLIEKFTRSTVSPQRPRASQPKETA